MTESTILGLSKNVVVAAGLAGAAFVGYCIYFDHKRRNAPDYKEKLRQKRRAQANPGHAGGKGGVPSPSDPAGMQAFFLQEVQLGEEMMAQGNIDEGAEHIANAVVLCGQSQQLLSIFQQTLPPDQFAAVVSKLPTTRERLSTMFGTGTGEDPFSSESSIELVENSGTQIQELMDDELE